jgi:hypothetical protein
MQPNQQAKTPKGINPDWKLTVRRSHDRTNIPSAQTWLFVTQAPEPFHANIRAKNIIVTRWPIHARPKELRTAARPLKASTVPSSTSADGDSSGGTSTADDSSGSASGSGEDGGGGDSDDDEEPGAQPRARLPANSPPAINADDLPEVLTIKEVTKLLRVERKTTYSWSKKGLIPGALKTPYPKRYSKAALLRWMRQGLPPAYPDYPDHSRPEVLTVAEAARLLNTTVCAVREWVRRGFVPGVLETPRPARISCAALLRWITQGQEPGLRKGGRK